MYLLMCAVVPPLLLLFYILHLDKIEREPIGQVLKIFFLGCLSVIPAIILELVGENVLSLFLGGDKTSIIYKALDYFIVVAVSEEFCKRYVMMKFMWNNPNFNYRFDAVIYCAASAVGFAAAENFEYMLVEGTGIILARLIPVHAICGIFMGYYIGQAKVAQRCARRALCRHYKFLSMLVPVALHGFYDFALSSESYFLITLAMLMVVIATIAAFITLRRASKKYAPV